MADTDVVNIARRRQTRWLARGLALQAALLPIGAGVGYFVVADELDSGVWWFFLGLTVVTIIYSVVLMMFLAWRRRRGARWAQPPLLLGVDLARRKRIVKSVRAREPVEGRDQEIAVDVAQRLVRQRRSLRVIPVFVVLWLWQIVRHGLGPMTWIMVAAIVLFVIAVPITLRDVRRGRDWLETYSS